MKTYDLVEGLEQNYSLYTDEDRKVWQILFGRQIKELESLAVPEYLEGIKKIGFKGDEIPNFKTINQRLKELTGWKIRVVPGIINEFDFFTMLSKKEFPSTTWLRKMSELEYLSEPDMFHDAFGHMPLLTHPTFCNFFQQLGEIGLQHFDQPEIVKMLGRVYWFTIEFGLIQQEDKMQIYGAGILSSIGETKYSLSEVPKRKAFDIVEIMHTHFENDRIQNLYFVINSFEQLYDSVESMIAEVKKEANKLRK